MTTLHAVGVSAQSHQVVSHNAQQQQQQTIAYQTVQAQPTSNVIYNASASRQTGYGQVILGVLSVMIGIAAIVLDCSYSVIASPIWSGAGFFIVAGILGITSAGNRNNSLIIGHMVMSILASLAAFQMMCLMMFAALVENNNNCNYIYDVYGLSESYCEKYYGRIAVDSIGGLVALSEFVIAIIAAAVCCHGSCGSNIVATQQTVVHHYMPNQSNMTVMTNPQTMAAHPGYIHQPQGYSINAYNNQAFNMPQQASQGVPSMQGPNAPQVDLPPPYKYEDYKAGGLPMPQD